MRLEYVTTTYSGNVRNMKTGEQEFTADTGIENQVINLYPEVEYQCFEGFGGAFTESAAYIYSLMDENLKSRLTAQYFDPDRMNYQFGRIHMDSCDFSLGQYEAVAREDDREMKSFSLERTRNYILPFIKDVQKKTGKTIELMVSPWSPPAFMKTNGRRSGGGKLKKEYCGFWADYLCRYITELEKEGVKVGRMSIQNEPKAVQTWDSCIYSAEEEKEFLKDYLYPALQRHGLDRIEIYIWDHNKERVYERACAVIDSETSHMISGIAFHWYSGDHFEALELVRKKFPDKKLILSEACIEYSKYSAKDYLANAQKYAHDIIGNLNGGMNAFYDWNLILDEKGGPNHVNNFCAAPYLYDVLKGELQEQNTMSYIWHFSHYIQPKAVRIGFSRYTKALEMTAFKNPDKTLALILLNTSQEERKAVIRLQGEMAEITVAGESVMSLTIEGSH